MISFLWFLCWPSGRFVHFPCDGSTEGEHRFGSGWCAWKASFLPHHPSSVESNPSWRVVAMAGGGGRCMRSQVAVEVRPRRWRMLEEGKRRLGFVDVDIVLVRGPGPIGFQTLGLCFFCLGLLTLSILLFVSFPIG
ncbi:unnamed protein product, partial [Linum tenue]